MKKNILYFILSLIPVIQLFSFSDLEANNRDAERKQDLDVVFIGNSITQGSQYENPQLESPPAITADYLRHQPGVGNVEFINQGRSGYTTVDFLPSAGGTFEKVVAATNQLHKDKKHILVFSISLGTNDSAGEGPNGSPVSPGEYYKNLKSIVDNLLTHFPESKIFLQQPIWYSPNTYNRSRYLADGLARLESYFPEIHSLVEFYSGTKPVNVFMGDQKGFAFFREHHLTYLSPESGKEGTFYLHPNKKGSEILGKLWGEVICQRLLKN
jgi:lysophospholipase L1-like esterase